MLCNCPVCGKTFKRSPSHLKQSTYCSWTCWTSLDGTKWRLWSKIAVAGHDDCWLWKARCNPKGYGTFRAMLAHRKVWEYEFGPIPDGLSVLHRCDNPPCCNPRHLFLGTRADNARDRDMKGRGYWPGKARGESNATSKLKTEQIAKIRKIRSEGRKLREIAADFGVTEGTICMISKHKTWRHV